ncbi:MAG TPA: cyclic peptide export ABC transporter [Kofleriaceae bacterium]
MEYLRFLKRQSNAVGVGFIAIAILSGVSTGLLVGVIISGASASDASSPLRTYGLFAASFLLFTVARKHVLDGTARTVEQVIRKVRIRIVEMIPHTELPAFESIGRTRISHALSQDVRAMSEAAYSVTSAFASAVLVVCAFIYIAMLSVAACVSILCLLVIGAAIYMRNYAASRPLLDASWQAETSFFDHLSDQLSGFNELKLNAAKAQDLLENDVVAMAMRSEHYKLAISRSFNWNMIFGQAFLYVVMAICIFVLPRVFGGGIPLLQLLSVVLFINGPIAEVIAAAPFLARANFAIKKITALETELRAVVEDQPGAAVAAVPFRALHCDGITYRYPKVEGQREFAVGPLDLEIRRGEITFVIGGNGTGKSTFLKLLCGLLQPDGGRVTLNDQPVTPARLAQYRASFSIILQDFRLFRRLLGQPTIPRQRIDELLTTLQLTGITDIDAEGRFTSTKLSTGQKKRLALLVAELDDREVFVFDEWAADQDPEFRKFFYESYLSRLRDRGKTVIAATHDDHYFHLADRIIKLDNGRIASAERVGSAPARIGAVGL